MFVMVVRLRAERSGVRLRAERCHLNTKLLGSTAIHALILRVSQSGYIRTTNTCNGSFTVLRFLGYGQSL